MVVNGPITVPLLIVTVVIACEEPICTMSPSLGVPGKAMVKANKEPAGFISNLVLPVEPIVTVAPVDGVAYWIVGTVRESIVYVVAAKQGHINIRYRIKDR